MRAGTLTETITVKEQTTVKDEYGIAKQQWTDVMTLRASVNFRSGDRIVENFEAVNTHLVTITTHLRRRIRRQMRILYDGETYVIQSVFHDRSKARTIIDCELLNE